MKGNSAGKHQVRIIAGQYRHRVLPVITAPGLRPTPDRVRETLFNWLGHFWDLRFDNKQVLDLFAGTGALGFEAASRGCPHVQMVENNPACLKQLRANRDLLKASQVRIHSHDALLVLSRMDASRFDLVLLDPPYQSDLLQKVIPYLPQICAPGALVYIEDDAPVTLPGATLLREGKAGQVHYHLFQLNPTDEKHA